MPAEAAPASRPLWPRPSPKCQPQVMAIHFNGPESLAVEWIDGTITNWPI